MEYELIEQASTGQLIDFWKYFRAGFKAQGATSPADMTDPEFYYCVVDAGIRAGWFISKEPERKAVRKWSFAELEEVAAPMWEVYQESSRKMDDDEKNG